MDGLRDAGSLLKRERVEMHLSSNLYLAGLASEE